MDTQFWLRDAGADDQQLIDFYANLEGMDNMPGHEHIRVAVNEDNQAVGFCRIAKDKQGIAYVNPVVVYEPWRYLGVGRALIEDAHAREGELRLVARGQSVEFYRALGFVEMSWDDVDLEAADEDCDNCPMRCECGPVPMRLA